MSDSLVSYRPIGVIRSGHTRPEETPIQPIFASNCIGREDNVLLVEGVDILDGTPLLDIKPYSRRFDNIQTQRNGWQDEVDDAGAVQRGVRNYRKKGEKAHEHSDRFQP